MYLKKALRSRYRYILVECPSSTPSLLGRKNLGTPLVHCYRVNRSNLKEVIFDLYSELFRRNTSLAYTIKLKHKVLKPGSLDSGKDSKSTTVGNQG